MFNRADKQQNQQSEFLIMFVSGCIVKMQGKNHASGIFYSGNVCGYVHVLKNRLDEGV